MSLYKQYLNSKTVTVHGYKVKPRITLIFTDSFLANKLFYDKIFIIIDKNVSFVIINIAFYGKLTMFIHDIHGSKIVREWFPKTFQQERNKVTPAVVRRRDLPVIKSNVFQ